MQRDDRIEVRALKADGTIYRWWRAVVESTRRDRIVTISRPGDEVHGPGGGWTIRHATRTYYWFSKPYNLAEVYHPNGQLKQIYIHIASPAQLVDGALVYTDHELDVVKRPGEALCVRDEDEFEVACSTYGYSPEFQCSCRDAVREALRLASGWRVSGQPQTRRRSYRRPSRAALARRERADERR